MDVDGRFVHFGARDYDPRTGPSLQADPIGVAGGGNRYAYVKNDPANYVDPLGLWPDWTQLKDAASQWGRHVKRIGINSSRY